MDSWRALERETSERKVRDNELEITGQLTRRNHAAYSPNAQSVSTGHGE